MSKTGPSFNLSFQRQQRLSPFDVGFFLHQDLRHDAIVVAGNRILHLQDANNRDNLAFLHGIAFGDVNDVTSIFA